MDKEKIIQKIEKSLESIRPFLKRDDGDIKIVDFTDDGTVMLEFLGNCSTCSMSGMTFKNGIQESIKNDVPEVITVEVINLTEELA